MVGLLERLSPELANSPFYQALSRNKNAISGTLLGGVGYGGTQEGVRGMARGMMAGGQMDDQRNLYNDEMARQEQDRNQTVEWAIGQFPQLAGAPPELVARIAPDLYAQSLSGNTPDPTSAMQNYEYLVSQGLSQEDALSRAFSGGTTVNVGQSEYGSIPAGFELVTDPETGARRMQAIPGSPAYLDAQAEAEAATNREGVQTTTDAEQAATMLSSVDEALNLLSNSPTPVTGLGSRPLALSTDTPAGKFRSIIAPLKSGVAIGTMMRLKEASSTGATGFGQLNRAELQLLLDDMGSLDPDTTNPDIMRQTLERIQNRFRRVVADIKANVSPERIRELGLEELIASIDEPRPSTLNTTSTTSTGVPWRVLP